MRADNSFVLSETPSLSFFLPALTDPWCFFLPHCRNDLLEARFDVLHCLHVHPATGTLLPWCEVMRFWCHSVTPRRDARRARRRAACSFLCQAGLHVAPSAVWEMMPATQLGQEKDEKTITMRRAPCRKSEVLTNKQGKCDIRTKQCRQACPALGLLRK